MRYWVYINDKVDGPYEEERLAGVEGFTPDTLICAEEIAEGGSQEWIKASSIFEFDDATKTMTRAPLSEEELNAVSVDSSENSVETLPENESNNELTAAHFDNATTQLLIEKIDRLTREIEGMKGKLDEALAASAAAQAAVTQHTMTAIPTAALSTQSPNTEEPVLEEALITSTESLVNHAEELVAQASTGAETEEKMDFLDEIQIDSPKVDGLTEKGGEELVLRSALDSLYGAKEQTEEEKEATFQDLLSPLKTAAVAAGVAGAAAMTIDALTGEEKKEEKVEEPAAETPVQEETPAEEKVEEVAQEPVTEEQQAEPIAEIATIEEPAQEETPTEEKVEEVAQEPVTEEKQEEPIAEIPSVEEPAQTATEENLTEEQREELINELTAPSQQNDFILQALQEAEKEQTAEEPLVVDLPKVEETPAIEEDLVVVEESAKEEVPFAELPAEKDALNLEDQPQLNIAEEGIAKSNLSQEAAVMQESASVSPENLNTSMTPMNPEEPEWQKEITQTAKELVPGKVLEKDPNEGMEDVLISQADLDDAFAERTPTQQDFPLPEAAFPAPAQVAEETKQETPAQEPATQTSDKKLPEGKGFYNPAEMTEVELKEGATYLISDFIPPAEAGRKESVNPVLGAVPGSPEAANAVATAATSGQEMTTTSETIEEIIPSKRDSSDLTMSKVILENTIKTKRGATMDIKTVPMVQEPADTERLDLSASDLADINTQHDIKTADFKQPNGNLTKIILGSLVSVIFLALIYVMLAYLELLPAQFNFLKKGPSVEQIQEQENKLEEMLIEPDDSMDLNQPMQAQPMPLPDIAENQLNPQTVTAEVSPLDAVLTEVKHHLLPNAMTLEQLINTKHAVPAAQNLIEWNITTAVEPDNYSILVKVPPENPQSFKISYRFNYNAVTKALDPTISDSKNLLDSITPKI